MKKRNLELLMYLNLHKQLTVENWHKRFLPNATSHAAVSWKQRLCDLNIIKGWKLYGKRKYYALSGYGARLLRKTGIHVSRKAHLPLKARAKAEYYAIGEFCNEHERSARVLYRPFFDADKFPRIAAMKFDPLHKKYFVRDGELIYLFFLDSGTAQFLNENVIPKVFTLLDANKYLEFRELGRSGLLRLVISTATESRADELLSRLHDNPPPFGSEVIVYPQLQHLFPLRAQPVT